MHSKSFANLFFFWCQNRHIAQSLYLSSKIYCCSFTKITTKRSQWNNYRLCACVSLLKHFPWWIFLCTWNIGLWKVILVKKLLKGKLVKMFLTILLQPVSSNLQTRCDWQILYIHSTGSKRLTSIIFCIITWSCRN